MTLKKLLLSSLLLASMTISANATVKANEPNPLLSLKVQNNTLIINHLSELPQDGKISYALWSQNKGTDDLVIYEFQSTDTSIPLRQHQDFGDYNLEVYHTLNGRKTLLASQTFQRLDPKANATSNASQPTRTTASPINPITSTTHPTTTNQPIAPTVSQQPPANPHTATIVSKPVSTPSAASSIPVESELTTSSSNQTNSTATSITSPKTSEPKIITSFSKTNTLSVTVTGIPGQPHEVLLPTWTEKGGQDDIQWYSMKRQASGDYSLEISLKNHNYETGTYNLHLYQRPKAGEALTILAGITVQAPSTSKPSQPSTPETPKQATFSIDNINKTSGSYVLSIKPEKAIKAIDVAVWSTNNQSNLKWYTLKPNSTNQYRLTISKDQHQQLDGIYNNHIYITYSNGNKVGYVAPTADLSKSSTNTVAIPKPNPTPAPTPSLSTSSNYLRPGFYALRLNNAEPGDYVFAVWSDKNGQDDIGWYNASASGNKTYTYQLDLSKHKDSGLYHFHIYKRTSTGLTGVMPSSFTVSSNHLATPINPVTPPVTTPSIPTTFVATNYPIGQCTWGAKQVAPWIGEWWGHAKSWANVAQNLGYTVGTTPRVGAVAVWPTDGGGYGHVAVVTHVESANRIQVLESNYAGKQYISNFRGWFNPNLVWNAASNSYVSGPVSYIYPKN